MKKGRFVYKNEECMKKMHEFYDRTLAALDVPFSEDYFDTSFGRTHCLLAGDKDKPRICTIHGGNGITTLNLRLFLPLLEEYCIIAPDVIGMPGKSEPYRNISSKKDEYGIWIREVLDYYQVEKISFVVVVVVCILFRKGAAETVAVQCLLRGDCREYGHGPVHQYHL